MNISEKDLYEWVFEIKNLLNFQRLASLEILLKFKKEQNNGEWSVDRTFSV